ncbi:hypothetical protein BLNAU_24854 [Blattamonas nauphoetae]|uniref:Uncharacterized protein n=1 Tax=Blattamonas nauphoetae TaxID=2049346 RepID=A0ABQ9WL96_9EUKA|nr:hypothetical protein BLNAU_24854 [Blattamonas nauphoetae]
MYASKMLSILINLMIKSKIVSNNIAFSEFTNHIDQYLHSDDPSIVCDTIVLHIQRDSPHLAHGLFLLRNLSICQNDNPAFDTIFDSILNLLVVFTDPQFIVKPLPDKKIIHHRLTSWSLNLHRETLRLISTITDVSDGLPPNLAIFQSIVESGLLQAVLPYAADIYRSIDQIVAHPKTLSSFFSNLSLVIFQIYYNFIYAVSTDYFGDPSSYYIRYYPSEGSYRLPSLYHCCLRTTPTESQQTMESPSEGVLLYKLIHECELSTMLESLTTHLNKTVSALAGTIIDTIHEFGGEPE